MTTSAIAGDCFLGGLGNSGGVHIFHQHTLRCLPRCGGISAVASALTAEPPHISGPKMHLVHVGLMFWMMQVFFSLELDAGQVTGEMANLRVYA